MGGDAQPTIPFPEGWDGDAAASRRRRRWPWLVAVLIVVVLVVVAFLLGEWITRDLVQKAVRQQVVSQLALPADQEVDVDIPGSVLWQLATGTVEQATVASDDVTVGDVTGDVVLELHDVALRDGLAMSAGAATVTLDAAQLQALMATIEGFPAETLGLAEPNVTLSTELTLLGATFPLGVALTPSAEGGDLVLTPAELRLGDAAVTADDLRSRFGALADPVLRDWRVCVAQYLPSGVPLEGVRVTGDRLVASFAVSGSILTDPAQRAKGTCA